MGSAAQRLEAARDGLSLRRDLEICADGRIGEGRRGHPSGWGCRNGDLCGHLDLPCRDGRRGLAPVRRRRSIPIFRRAKPFAPATKPTRPATPRPRSKRWTSPPTSGIPGALWKLGRMYQTGDLVDRGRRQGDGAFRQGRQRICRRKSARAGCAVRGGRLRDARRLLPERHTRRRSMPIPAARAATSPTRRPISAMPTRSTRWPPCSCRGRAATRTRARRPAGSSSPRARAMSARRPSSATCSTRASAWSGGRSRG